MAHKRLCFSLLVLETLFSNRIPLVNAEIREDLVVDLKLPKIDGPFFEPFDDSWDQRWQPSEALKKDEALGGDQEQLQYRGTWVVEPPVNGWAIKTDKGLVLKTPYAHHAISASFDQPIDPTGKDLVVQYEVKLQDGLECGGAYLKLLTQSEDGIKYKEFDNRTPYTIMFGPDKCGMTNKVHFIFRHRNPVTGEYEEKHLDPAPLAGLSKKTQLYTLIVKPDNSFEILIDNESVKKGSLLNDFKPPVNPIKEIDDPDDFKPSDWVDEVKIPDPNAVKPEDWDESAPKEIEDVDAVRPEDWLEDEPEMIEDPEAKKPEDWDDEEDGEWTPPLVSNPKCAAASGCGPWKRPMKKNPNYRGKWKPPMIDNPDYKGEWKPRKIPNPAYFEDNQPANFEPMSGIGFELWTLQKDILFDNIYVGHSVEDAAKLAETWKLKRSSEDEEEEKRRAEAQEKLDQEEDDGIEPDPHEYVAYIKYHFSKFTKAFQASPIDAVKEMPYVAAGAAATTLTFIGIVSLLIGLLSSSKSRSVGKKSGKKAGGSSATAAEKKQTSKSGGSDANADQHASKKAKVNADVAGDGDDDEDQHSDN